MKKNAWLIAFAFSCIATAEENPTTQPATKILDLKQPSTKMPELTEPLTNIPDLKQPSTKMPELTEPLTNIPNLKHPVPKRNPIPTETPVWNADRKDDGTLVISSLDCAFIETLITQMRQWKQRIGEPFEDAQKEPPKVERDGDKCLFTVHGSAPDFVSSNCGVPICYDGPNCWNACLAVNKILPGYRHTTAPEMYFWMNSPLCRMKKTSEKPEPGDIIAIRRKNPTGGPPYEIHGYVWINESMAFTKNGRLHKNQKKDGSVEANTYILQPPHQIHAIPDYGNSDPQCQLVEQPPESCVFFSQVYTCKTFSEFDKDKEPHASLESALGIIHDTECSLSNMVTTNTPDTKTIELLNTFAPVLLKIRSDLISNQKQIIDSAKNDEEKKMQIFYGQLAVGKIEGLLFQLDMTNRQYQSGNLKELKP